jgi:putative phosphoesterase
MRIAIFSDIHGNDLAFEAVEADIKKQNVDQIVCLGDAIQGGPQPAAVVQRLRALNCPVVMGNADAWLITGVETGNEEIEPERLKKMEAIRQWSLSQLNADDQEFIADFQATITIPLEKNLELLCFHASPDSFDDVIAPAAPQEVVQKYLGNYAQHILTGGHTHAQQVRRNGEFFFFNPGSVGLVFSEFQNEDKLRADRWAEYAILTVENGNTSLEFRRIPYDMQALAQVYRTSGRPFAEEALAQYQR